MESSQSNTLSASIGSGQSEPQTVSQQQTETQVESQTGSDVNVGGKRKKGGSVVWDHCKKIKKKDDKEIPVLTNETMGAALVPHTFNQKRHELMCVKYIIRDELPFRAVEGVGFKDFITDLQPRFKIPNRKKIAAGVLDLFLLERAKIMSVIGDQRVSITTDTWTSIQNINYMVVTAHFLDSDWNLHKRIINFTKITSHKGDDIGRCLERCLHSWGISKVFSVTVDNASANYAAVEYMAKRFKALNTLMLDGKYLHMRCACHILNLIVKDGLKELYSSIEGIRNCVKYIHSSPARLDEFREFAFLQGMDKMSNVPVDVATRWNATYKMLEGALKYRMLFERMGEESDPFVTYFNEYEKDASSNLVKRVGPPGDEDWEKAQAYVHFLKKIYQTTLKLSATKTCTSNIIWQKMVGLQSEIMKKMRDGRDPTLQKVATLMKQKFDKYWGSFETMNKLVFVAEALDPRLKLQMIRITLSSIGADPSSVEQVVGEVKECLLALYNDYKGVESIGSRAAHDVGGGVEVADGDEEDDLGAYFMRVLMQQRIKQQLVENEVVKYLSDPFESLMADGFNILNWWRGNATRYPILAKIAKDIFAIPSSTVASENAFSLGGRIVDPFRASLTPKMVEALVCTNDWLKTEEFSFYKEPTDEEVEFYRQLEDIEASSTLTQASASASAMQS